MTAPVEYIPGFLALPDQAFDSLWRDLSWEQRSPARKEYWTNALGRDYTYGSGVGARTYQSQPSHHWIELISTKLEVLLGFRYEGCFLNGYEGARNALGWHADDDPGIDHSRPIAVVTVGEGRWIDFMVKYDKSTKESLFLEPGSLLLMKPGMQDTHFHQIPKAGYVVRRPRISLTYRSLLP